MPRFSVAFSRRKSTADEFENVPVASPDQQSFRVIERQNLAPGRSFDGGARLSRPSGPYVPKGNHLEVQPDDDNIFADMKRDRGSGVSNTTKGASTDNSSRHSNTSTAPSSTDAGAYALITEEKRGVQLSDPQESFSRSSSSKTYSFLNKAGRTFSFGQRKQSSTPPPTKEEPEPPVPDLPPVLSLVRERDDSRSRGLTASTTSTVTPSHPQQSNSGLDLGGDFGSMFSTFDKRSSTATLTMDTSTARSLTGNRGGLSSGPLSPLSPGSVTAGDSLLHSNTSSSSPRDFGPGSGSLRDHPSSISRQQTPGSFKYSNRHSDIVEDEDAKLLQDSFTAIKFLSSNDNHSNMHASRYKRDDESFAGISRKPIASDFSREENMFDNSASRFSRMTSSRYTPRTTTAPKNKVMTPAEFEQYRQDKERQNRLSTAEKEIKAAPKDEDDEDEINYDDDEDEMEKTKKQAKQRRKQEAHMTVYRQQMMKVTGETQPPISRPSLPPSNSAPQLSRLKAPSPQPQNAVSDEEDDEEVPLAILQAHGFPAKNRPPTRLASTESNPNLRASMQPQPARPSSSMGETSGGGRRQSGLPAFARNLPQDPFVGASIARPAVRESLSFGDADQSHHPQQSQQNQGLLPPGGLVGVIANEERSRAMRRGSPNMESQRLMGGAPNGYPSGGFDPAGGVPHQAMYGQGPGQGPMGYPGANGMPSMPSMASMQGMAGMPGMPSMPQMMSPGDQAQIQMTQQMSQFMQMQMQFMQMMAGNQNSGNVQGPPHPPMHQPQMQSQYGNQSMLDLNSRHSIVGDQFEPPQMNQGMRTMSMVQPSSASFMNHVSTPSIHHTPPVGYTPSIAPSERSNVGLPGRYRPVSHSTPSPVPSHNRTPSTLSGALSAFDDSKSRSTLHVVSKSRDVSDDDDEEGWETMKAMRDKKRSVWRSKKNLGSELNTLM